MSCCLSAHVSQTLDWGGPAGSSAGGCSGHIDRGPALRSLLPVVPASGPPQSAHLRWRWPVHLRRRWAEGWDVHTSAHGNPNPMLVCTSQPFEARHGPRYNRGGSSFPGAPLGGGKRGPSAGLGPIGPSRQINNGSVRGIHLATLGYTPLLICLLS